MKTIEEKIEGMSAEQMKAALLSLAKWSNEPAYTSLNTDYSRGYHSGIITGKDIVADRIEAAAEIK